MTAYADTSFLYSLDVQQVHSVKAAAYMEHKGFGVRSSEFGVGTWNTKAKIVADRIQNANPKRSL